MEVMYQRRCANYVYVIPEGLRELMSDISREVLRDQPKNLYSYITTYLEALMITRENARVAAKMISHMADSSEVIASLLQRTNMTKEQANKVCRVIQKAFRKHLRRKITKHDAVDRDALLQKIMKKSKITYAQAVNAVCVIQKAYKNFKLRRQEERKKDLVDWRSAYYNTLSIYKKAGATSAETARAATLIKAAYKGYYTRRVMKELSCETGKPDPHKKKYYKDGVEKELKVHETTSWQVKSTDQYRMNRAAKVIQEAFKKYQAKKKVEFLPSHSTVATTRTYEENFEEFIPPQGMVHPVIPHSEQEVYIETEEFEQMCEEIQLAAYEIDDIQEYEQAGETGRTEVNSDALQSSQLTTERDEI